MVMIDKLERKKKQGRTLLTQTTELPFLRREERRRKTKTLKRLYVWVYRCNSARVGKKTFFFLFWLKCKKNYWAWINCKNTL